MVSSPRRLRGVVSAVVLATALGGCVGAAVGGAAVGGVAMVQERSVTDAAKDTKLSLQIRELWLRHDHAMPTELGLEVYEGRALLTGVVDDEQTRADAVRLAWEISGLKDVINEIVVAEGTGIVDLARDSWITTSLEYAITTDRYVMGINYAIETVNGTVYLIGIAQDDEELKRVIDHARDISYVRNVISHVRIKPPSTVPVEDGTASGEARRQTP